MTPPAQPSRRSRLGRAEQQPARPQVLARLRRLQGQADGIARMIETDRPALDVLQQLAAFIAAAREVSVEYATGVLGDRLGHHIDDPQELQRAVSEARAVIERSARLP